LLVRHQLHAPREPTSLLSTWVVSMIARCVLVVTTAILQVLVTCSHMEINTNAPWVIIAQPVQAQSQSLAWQVHLSTKVRLIPPKLQVRP
jgi:hypothetical protein